MIRRLGFFGPLILIAALGIGAMLAGCGGGVSTVSPTSTAIPFTSGTVFVADPVKNQIAIIPPSPGPNTQPANPLSGTNTQLNGPRYMCFDGSHNLYVVNYSSSTQTSTLLGFQVGSQNNQAPTISISGSSTGLGHAYGVAVDSSLNIYVSNVSNGTASILIFSAGKSGNIAPTATITGNGTGFTQPEGLAFDSNQNLWVADAGNGTLREYPNYAFAGQTGTLNLTPVTVISGTNTGLKAPSDVILDGLGNIYASDSTANAIQVFANLTSGNASPIRTISGSSTALNAPSGIALAGDGTLYVANSGANDVLLFAPVSNGNVTPEATLTNSLGSAADVELSI